MLNMIYIEQSQQKSDDHGTSTLYQMMMISFVIFMPDIASSITESYESVQSVLSSLEFDDFDTDLDGNEIGWIKIANCTEGNGNPLQYLAGDESQLAQLAPYAITAKFVPNPVDDDIDDYLVQMVACSNPVIALNNRLEVSHTIDTTTLLYSAPADVNNWYGTATAKARLSNTNNCGTGGEPRSIASLWYQACGNGDGIHIYETSFCRWDFNSILGYDIEIYLGFDFNRLFVCDGEGTGESILICPTMSPTTDPTMDPTSDPTTDPTNDPTSDPTSDPTIDPTIDPTADPTMDPIRDPTRDPTIDPTVDPTQDPTDSSDSRDSWRRYKRGSHSNSGSSDSDSGSRRRLLSLLNDEKFHYQVDDQSNGNHRLLIAINFHNQELVIIFLVLLVFINACGGYLWIWQKRQSKRKCSSSISF